MRLAVLSPSRQKANESLKGSSLPKRKDGVSPEVERIIDTYVDAMTTLGGLSLVLERSRLDPLIFQALRA